MKKFFKKTFVVLGIMGMGFTTTSCEEVLGNLDWATLLTEVLGNVFNGGNTNAYQGNYSLQHLVSDGKGAYRADSEKLEFQGATCTATLGRNNAVNLLLPGTDGIGDATMTDVNVYNLEFVQDEKNGTVTNQVDLGDNSSIDGKLTVNGKEYAASNLYLECTLTENKLVIKTADIYFGDNGEHVIRVTFPNGTIVQQAQ